MQTCQEIQLCQGPDVIATLFDDSWFIPLPGGKYEIVDNEPESKQLYHCLSGDFTGYMIFRCVEYEDVQICVVFDRV